MGSRIIELMEAKEVSLKELEGKIYSVDAHNLLYQFLTTIRQRDGGYLRDSHGQVTSHLVGLFSRITRLMRRNMNFVFCFDGETPELKQEELERRKSLKKEAAEKAEEALAKGDEEEAFKYAQRTARLTEEMIEESKKLIEALGQCWVQAPSEGEAQAARMAERGDAYAVISQDADCFLFKAPRLVKNLTITGKRKLPGRHAYASVSPLLISLSDNLNKLGVSHEQLLVIAILVGTDYNPGGVKGIGPKKALKLVKEAEDYDELFRSVGWSEWFNYDWREVYKALAEMKVSDDYSLSFKDPDKEAVSELLVERHDFDKERVEKVMEELLRERSQRQKGLSEFF